MKKLLSVLLALTLLSSCSIKDEASGLYHRITGFITGSDLENNKANKDDKSKDLIELGLESETEYSNNTEAINQNINPIDDENVQVYNELIDKANSYANENDVDINKLYTDKGYMMKHALKFQREYDVDLSSLSSEDIENLQQYLNNN